jgi:hypothetical protein
MTDSTLPILREAAQVPGLLKDIYGDLAKPGVSQVGQALDTILGLGNTLLWPIQLLNEKAKIGLQRNLDKYRLQLKEIPADQIVAVRPEVGVPISEKLAYVTDHELSDLYINLLAKASTTHTAHFAHPSFVNIINNLSPDEAVLLKELRTTNNIPFITAQLVRKDPTGGWITLADILTGLERKTQITFQENTVAYFSNFEGLGIIEIRRDIFIVNPSLYEELERIYRPLCEANAFDREQHDLKFEQGKIEVTPSGRLFIDACLKKLTYNTEPAATTP